MAGGGVGEAMLIGAAVGAASGGGMAALKDEDPLQGALMGAALGAAGGGVGSFVGGAAGAASGTAGGAASGAAGGAGAGAAGGVAGGVEGGVAGGAGAGAAGALPAGQVSTLAGAYGSAAPLGSSIVPSAFPAAGAGAGAASGAGAGGASGLGTGMFPALTTAQAYGAGIGGGVAGLAGGMGQTSAYEPEPYNGPLSQFKYNPSTYTPTTYSPTRQFADGGVASLPVRQQDAYPQSGIESLQFSTPTQMPASMEVLRSDYDSTINPYTGDQMRFAQGGISNLGSYSDGGRLLRGPGDGMSDNIPASIAGKQPARLADGEFVVPADVVSHLGNGSTDAGAKKLYSMMDNVRKARTGSKKQGREIKSEKYIPGMSDGGIASFADGGYTPTIYGTDSTYYDKKYWEDRLAEKQDIIKNGEWTIYGNPLGKDFETITTTPGVQLIYGANGKYSQPYTVGESGIVNITPETFGGDPLYGTVKNAYIYNPQGLMPEYFQAIKKNVEEAQAAIPDIQKNVDRLSSSGVFYTPYTIANRPSQEEPQFYGNIYQPANFGEYARPGYDMNAGLGVWNNEYGGDATPTARQNKIAQMGYDQQAAQQQSLENAQAAALKSRQLINENINPAQPVQPPAQQQTQSVAVQQPATEDKKRRGGIASLRC